MTPGSAPGDSDKQLARAAARAIGAAGQPHVVRVYDEQETTHVDVMVVADAFSRPLSTFSTLGLQGNAALLVMQAWLAAPGVIYPDLVTDYGLSENLPHVLLTAPFPFPELNAIGLDDGPTVHWLMAVPISESERQYVVANGLNAFEQLLEQADASYWDFSRDAVA